MSNGNLNDDKAYHMRRIKSPTNDADGRRPQINVVGRSTIEPSFA